MRIAYPILLLTIALPSLVLAQVECTDKPECWPEGSAMRTGLLLNQKQPAADQRLAQKHNELVKLVASSAPPGIYVDERLVEALKSQQEAWKEYTYGECELIGALTGTFGHGPTVWAAQCVANHTDLRLRRVRSAIACIEKIPADGRNFEQNHCLQQLAPLTNR
jgi:uncharacterized protein YecT (DUF1311 family)